MLSLHHTHLFASDIDASIAFWREHFGSMRPLAVPSWRGAAILRL